jgi:hypothetical protein
VADVPLRRPISDGFDKLGRLYAAMLAEAILATETFARQQNQASVCSEAEGCFLRCIVEAGEDAAAPSLDESEYITKLFRRAGASPCARFAGTDRLTQMQRLVESASDRQDEVAPVSSVPSAASTGDRRGSPAARDGTASGREEFSAPVQTAAVLPNESMAVSSVVASPPSSGADRPVPGIRHRSRASLLENQRPRLSDAG